MANFEERTALECQFLSERGIPWHEVQSYNYQQKHELQLRYLGWLLQKVDKYKNELRQLEAALSPAAGVYQPLIESDGSIRGASEDYFSVVCDQAAQQISAAHLPLNSQSRQSRRVAHRL